MSAIILGENAKLDIDRLLSTRLLVQANSGKGKSHLLRRIAELFFGKVQVIIIDPEGEFATLREEYGYVLVGKGGETPADPRSAALVAHKLLELKASAVCDLYEMKPAMRHEWVAKFIDAMIDAPKNLWHPCVVIVDEAHVFCPEKGAGESQASEAMIGLATRGRKRGFACIFATQRLGKLRKDAAAELLNVMIGGTFIDVDRKRAADALGVYGAEQHKFFDEIKLLPRGHFFALGPAISDERILVRVGPVKTTHPEAGSAKRGAGPPPAPEAVAKLLPKLSDLPKAAEEKAKTETELRAEIRTLKQQLRTQPAQKAQATAVDSRAVERALTATFRKFEEERKKLRSAAEKLFLSLQFVARTASESAEGAIALLQKHDMDYTKLRDDLHKAKDIPGGQIQREQAQRFTNSPVKPPVSRVRPDDATAFGDLTASQRKVLTALAQIDLTTGEKAPSREQLAFWADAPPTSGGYKNNLGALRTAGYIEYPQAGTVSLTDSGRALVGQVDALSTEDLQQRALSLLTDSQRKIFDEAMAFYPAAVDRETLAECCGVPVTSGGFKNNLGALRTAGIIIYPSPGEVRVADWVSLNRSTA